MDIQVYLFISLIFLTLVVYIMYKYNKFIIKNTYDSLLNKTQSYYDKKAHNGMNCTVLKKVMRPDLGAGVEIHVVSDSCYDGLPHTLDEYSIVIPNSLFEKGGIELDKVLEHELVHILQRRFNSEWQILYSQYKWKLYDNFDFLEHSELMSNNELNDLLESVRYNPDISYNPFAVYDNRYLFLSVYVNKIDPKVRQAKKVIYDLKEKRIIDGFPPDYADWMKTNQCDHPHEIFAELLSSLDYETMKRIPKHVKRFYEYQKKKLFIN